MLPSRGGMQFDGRGILRLAALAPGRTIESEKSERASVLSLKFVDKKMSNQKTRKVIDAGLNPDFQKGRYRRGLKPRPFKASPLNQRTSDSEHQASFTSFSRETGRWTWLNLHPDAVAGRREWRERNTRHRCCSCRIARPHLCGAATGQIARCRRSEPRSARDWGGEQEKYSPARADMRH